MWCCSNSRRRSASPSSVAPWTCQRHHLREVVVSGDGRQPGAGRHAVQQRDGHRMAAGLHGRPVVGALERDRRRHRQEGRDVARALPLQPALQHRAAQVGVEAAVSRHLLGITPARHGGVQALVVLGAHVQERGALGRAQPLVQVAGVEVGAHGVQVQRDLAGRVRAVDHRQQPARTRRGAEFGHREDQRRGGRDVADEDHPRARSGLGQHLLDEALAPSNGSGTMARR